MASLANLITSITIIIIFISIQSSVAQQPYVGVTTSDCNNNHNSSSGLGYFCNGVNTTCRTYLTFRSRPPYDTVASISTVLSSDPTELSALNSVQSDASFEANRLVLVPITCSCAGQNYQLNTSYTTVQDDTYFGVATNVFQGLSTCQAIANQGGNPPARALAVGQRLTVPLRCACPTNSQSGRGVNYLLSYLVARGDSVSVIAERFGVSVDSIFEANDLSQGNANIINDTTLLVPLQTPPTSNQTLEPTPSTPTTPTGNNPSSSPPSSSEESKTWLYALIGAVSGVGFVLVLGFVLYCKVLRPKKKKKKTMKSGFGQSDPVLESESFEYVKKKGDRKKDLGEELSQDFLEAMSDIAQSIKVYSFEELSKATSGFSPSNLIKGSVFRGVINGDLAAIKRVDGDISKEINLLQKINHFNVIRLSGVAFNEGYWYLVYEYASNGPLSGWLFSGKGFDAKFLSWTQRIHIALDVATGLNYLHSFSNPSHVHKDIKSGNILLDTDLRAKIANFGLARLTTQGGQDDQFVLTKHIVGTVGYMAPEYLEHGLVSTKLDVYAFGVVLLEMLTGKEVSLLHEENKKLSDVFGDVDGKEKGLMDFMDVSLGEKYPAEIVGFVVKIIDSCLQKNVEARPNMDEIVQLLSITLSNSLTWESSQGY